MNICNSGASKGADYLWGINAQKAGHFVRHYSFHGHAAATKEGLIILNELQLSQGDDIIKKANSYLKRTYPTRSVYVNNLIRRNYWQILGSERVYATQRLGTDDLVAGGTGFTVTMAILSGIKEIYLFEPDMNKWLQWTGDLDGDRTWIEVEPPKPHGIYTGIGAHDLEMNSMIAINKLYESD